MSVAAEMPSLLAGGPRREAERAGLKLIAARRSIPALTAPAPSVGEVNEMLRAAVSAPDHGRLRPWRFVVLAGEAPRAFGDVLASAYERRCALAGITPRPGHIETERQRPLRAPMIIAVGAHLRLGRITRDAQLCAVAAATQNLLLAATELGYGTMWRTGSACGDEGVKQALGLRGHDVLVGFIYIGTKAGKPPARPAPSLNDVVRWWDPDTAAGPLVSGDDDACAF